MPFLEHLDELRARLFRCAIAFIACLAVCLYFSRPLLRFLLEPMRRHLAGGGEIVFLDVTEPFLIYMKTGALASIFLASPYLLYQVWGFVAPGLYRNERRMAALFVLFGSLFFALGGAFGYYVAVPYSVSALLKLGGDFKAALTLRAAFQFLSRVILGMGAVFELPIAILILSRVGVVTPAGLMRYFRHAVVAIAVAAALITPTGDMLTMSIFAVPMILLYLLGVAVAWAFGRRTPA